MRMKGTAYFFSVGCSPGSTKRHTCQRMPGEATNSPAIRATFICTQKASVGEVKISVYPIFLMGRAR